MMYSFTYKLDKTVKLPGSNDCERGMVMENYLIGLLGHGVDVTVGQTFRHGTIILKDEAAAELAARILINPHRNISATQVLEEILSSKFGKMKIS